MIKLYKGDCLKVLPYLIQTKTKIDIVITSPPYNLNISYNTYKDNKPLQEYLSWTDSYMKLLYTLLSSSSSFFLNISGSPTNPLVPFKVLEIALSNGFTLQNTIHWIKFIFIDKTYGHYKPINSPRFLNDTHEYIFHLTKSGNVKLDRLAIGVPYSDPSNIKRWKTNNTTHCRGNTWYIPYKTRQSKEPHPATFPPILAEYCIKLHSYSNNTTVLDPFSGIGNTGIAAKSLNTNFIGIEIDEIYFNISKERLKYNS